MKIVTYYDREYGYLDNGVKSNFGINLFIFLVTQKCLFKKGLLYKLIN